MSGLAGGVGRAGLSSLRFSTPNFPSPPIADLQGRQEMKAKERGGARMHSCLELVA